MWPGNVESRFDEYLCTGKSGFSSPQNSKFPESCCIAVNTNLDSKKKKKKFKREKKAIVLYHTVCVCLQVCE